MMPRTNASSLFDQKQLSGFTIIELLITIAIIGFLVTTFSVYGLSSREKAKLARAKDDLAVIKKASQIILTDLNKWPFGCNPEVASFNISLSINDSQSGIFTRPTVGDTDGSSANDCAWASRDLSFWNGSYLDNYTLKDPWANDYFFEGQHPDINNIPKAAILSQGPINNDNSDDIFLDLK